MVTSPTVTANPNAPPGSASPATKLIAFYLPQYHPIPENDEWWGNGFTEWTNVTKAKPLFRGHYQPHLPADLGFYDLRLPEARESQAALAKEYGIHGFCYYHYWFHGKRLLERPFNEVLASGKPDFRFCLCWANESWNRSWDGQEQQILMAQTYSPQDDLNHIRWLIRVFQDHRYIRIDGRPLVLVYRAADLPSASRTAETWRQETKSAGIGDIFLCTVQSHLTSFQLDPTLVGFDAALEFPPSFLSRPALLKRLWRRLLRGPSNNRILKYSGLMKHMLDTPTPRFLRLRCVTPSWDNTARRRERALIFKDSSPDKYAEWLKCAIAGSPVLDDGNKFVFINAWNEWAEGNHLEPCQAWGTGYLAATRQVLDETDSRQ